MADRRHAQRCAVDEPARLARAEAVDLAVDNAQLGNAGLAAQIDIRLKSRLQVVDAVQRDPGVDRTSQVGHVLLRCRRPASDLTAKPAGSARSCSAYRGSGL